MTSRRNFLLLRRPDGALEVSCEALVMRLVDARLHGGRGEWKERLAAEIVGAPWVRVRQSGWMAEGDVRALLQPLLEIVRDRGGRVEEEAA